MSTLFISDLHLGVHNLPVVEGFCHWLKLQQSAQKLYILGDFFDAWIGDDEDHPLIERVCDALKQYSATTPTFLMKGNRDFLIGADFSRKTGVTLLDDIEIIDLYGEPTLLMHGDTLCTGDKEYMQFRAMVRDPQWQHQILSLPLGQRRQMAAELRAKSRSMNALKAEDILDVEPAEVIRVMNEYKVARLIHGHTHRPAVHDVKLNKGKGQRWVLGDWQSTGWRIDADETGMELVEFVLPTS